MKSFIALACLALPLAAQEVTELKPFFIEVYVDQPLSGIKDSVGKNAGLGANLGYVFHSQQRHNGSLAMAFKIDEDQFSDKSTKREAHGVGIGPEFTVYFRPDFKGVFLSGEALFYAWSLTNRNTGDLQNQTYFRSGGALSVGYRFRNGCCVEAVWKSVVLDRDLRMESLGLGFRMHL